MKEYLKQKKRLQAKSFEVFYFNFLCLKITYPKDRNNVPRIKIVNTNDIMVSALKSPSIPNKENGKFIPDKIFTPLNTCSAAAWPSLPLEANASEAAPKAKIKIATHIDM